jgi:hypothetical protein
MSNIEAFNVALLSFLKLQVTQIEKKYAAITAKNTSAYRTAIGDEYKEILEIRDKLLMMRNVLTQVDDSDVDQMVKIWKEFETHYEAFTLTVKKIVGFQSQMCDTIDNVSESKKSHYKKLQKLTKWEETEHLELLFFVKKEAKSVIEAYQRYKKTHNLRKVRKTTVSIGIGLNIVPEVGISDILSLPFYAVGAVIEIALLRNETYREFKKFKKKHKYKF